jgi:hydrogenase maturation protease
METWPPDAASNPPRDDLLVIGIGNLVREDDGVGIMLVRRLNAHFSGGLRCLEIPAPDILLAETLAQSSHVLIIDAMRENSVPFRLIPLVPSKTIQPAGFVAHVLDWGAILAMSSEFFGKAPETTLLGVAAAHFGFSETLSASCQANADTAFEFLTRYCSKISSSHGLEVCEH